MHTVWGAKLHKRFCEMLSESSTGGWGRTAAVGKHFQNLLHNLTPQTLLSIRFHQRSHSLTLAPDFDVAAGFDDGGLEEPGEAETDEYVEHVAPDRVGHCHVTVALSAIEHYGFLSTQVLPLFGYSVTQAIRKQ